MSTDAAASVAPTSHLAFLRLGVRFTAVQTRAGTASCPADPAVRQELSEQVARRVVLLADGLDAATIRVEAKRRAVGGAFVTRTTRSRTGETHTSEVLPTGVCETCGEDMGWISVREGKSYIIRSSLGGMCRLCAMAFRKVLLARDALLVEKEKAA